MMWRDIRSGLIGGGVVAVGVFLSGFVVQVDGQVMLSGLALVFVAGAAAAVFSFEGRQRPQPPVQPVVQPVVAVRDNSFEDAQPLPVVNNYRSQPVQPARDDVLQPLATAPQPAATRSNGHVQPAAVEYPAIGLTWPEMVGRQRAGASPEVARGYVEPAAIAETDEDAGGVKADGALLPRREPTMTDYPLIWEVFQGTKSQNEAIKELWGSKDGKTHLWLSKVRDFYMLRPAIAHTRSEIIRYETEGTRDTLAVVAARLGVELEEVQAVVGVADLIRCRECEVWTCEPDLDVLGVCAGCGS